MEQKARIEALRKQKLVKNLIYKITKDMTVQEKINFYNEGGRAFLKEMEERKLQKV